MSAFRRPTVTPVKNSIRHRTDSKRFASIPGRLLTPTRYRKKLNLRPVYSKKPGRFAKADDRELLSCSPEMPQKEMPCLISIHPRKLGGV